MRRLLLKIHQTEVDFGSKSRFLRSVYSRTRLCLHIVVTKGGWLTGWRMAMTDGIAGALARTSNDMHAFWGSAAALQMFDDFVFLLRRKNLQ